MDQFGDIFLAYQKRGKATDRAGKWVPISWFAIDFISCPMSTEIEALDKQLAPWTSHNSPGKKRADSDKDTFSIKYGVYLCPRSVTAN